MKKIHSMLAILLILTSLLSVLVSCKQDVTPVEEEEETTTEVVSDGNKSYPLTEKDKENIYKNAMQYLSKGSADLAYDEFLKIPDYKNVPEYLARFTYHYTNAYEYSPDKVDHLNKFGYSYTKYGQPLKFTQRGEKSHDTQYVYDESSRFLTMLTDNPYVHHYYYDEVTGLRTNSTTQHGTQLTTTTYHYDDPSNPTRLTSYEDVVTSSSAPNVVISTATIEYTYNAQGNITKETKTETVPNTDPALAPTVTVIESIYTYNTDGTLARFDGYDILGKYSIVYEYENGLLMKETLTHEAEAPTITKENYASFTNFVYSRTSEYSYNEKGLLIGNEELSKVYEDLPRGYIGSEYLLFNEKIRTWQYTKHEIYYNPYA
ncbi:MAG: hypothetical protein J6Q82_00150 [Clostridia bacterium]|nr:hypothetical protein [Clostridia bacterium]